ncbi:L,D-transpeptidase [Hyphomicrobium methylovorum]|uniref:L,D-transpeptidase n=1 Tax=Hyphomicrobium methylovorum TaxID=84 RepID=UPI0015E69A3E|nr:L,D-transpeptidase [Hyphomicrobium methylovorum]MBA2124666.1 L,D-transpeptidase [Hyphomicrobium methylovorum]
MKFAFAAVGVLCAWALAPSVASAQGWDNWSSRRAPSSYDAPYRDDDAYDDDRYFERYDRRTERGSSIDDSDLRYDPRYNGGPAYGSRRTTRVPSYAPRYRDDDDAWDAALPPAEEARRNQNPGASGGNKPYIRAVAPPIVSFSGNYPTGSIVIDTSGRKLYYVLNSSSAYAYSIGVGRQGFSWTGKEKVSRVADWPDWYPPADMRKRRPDLPERMRGGIRNPLGAKAIYLGNTLYRIHGTNEPKSIGRAESSGCFRMMNENVLHLASLVRVGTEVTIVRSLSGKVASAKTSKAKTQNRSFAPRQPARDYDYDPYQDDWR